MAKLSFNYTDSLEDSREIRGAELHVPDDMDIWELKQVCARLALLMGYQQKTVSRAFGDYEDVDIRKLMKKK